MWLLLYVHLRHTPLLCNKIVKYKRSNHYLTFIKFLCRHLLYISTKLFYEINFISCAALIKSDIRCTTGTKNHCYEKTSYSFCKL